MSIYETLIPALEGIAKSETARRGDKSFAENLLSGAYGYFKRGMLTERQQTAALQMIERVNNPPPPPPEDHISSLSKVYAFIMAARQHLKWPKLILQMADNKHQLKIYMAGPRSKFPDTLNLVTNNEWGDMDLWLGRVFEDGRWQHRKGDDELREMAATLLEALADDPATVASTHGHMTGNCCFCHRPLRDKDRSLVVGYGPVCAKKWGLPWGKK